MAFVNITINVCNYKDSFVYQKLSTNNFCNVVAEINNYYKIL